MNNQNEKPSFEVPADFPSTEIKGAVSGTQAKILVTEFEGKYYAQGCSPPEVFQRWDICEDLAQQFSQKSLESKQGKRAHMSEQEILNQYFDRLLKTGWVSKSEAIWIFKRISIVLDWPTIT